ncbi:hypothetical protein EV401DRAFT_1975376 [Pisolithus croceorrhizus]|nr:hypothetical protein EV401DRAFT_1975376 [Pisolithus croceorrhizus]
MSIVISSIDQDLMSLQYVDAGTRDDTAHELSHLAARISDLQSAHDDMARVLKNLKVTAARIQNSKAPVSRLPSDVLSLIFEECHQSNPQWTGVLCLLGQLPIEVRLSHVSSQWREVALATPSLWSSIRFPFEQREDSLVEYLERSRGGLLDVYLGPWAKYPNLERALTTVLIPHLGRFQQLVLEAVSRETLTTLLSAFQDQSAPALRRLRVMCRAKGLPLLTDVRLDNVAITLPSPVATTLSLSAYPGPQFPMTREAFYLKAHALTWIHRHIACAYPHAFQSLAHTTIYSVRFSGVRTWTYTFLRATPAVSDLVLSVDRYMRLIRLLTNSDKQAAGYAGNVVGTGVPLNEPSPTMALLQEFVRIPISVLPQFNNEFLWGLNQMKQYVRHGTDSGYVADWGATVDAYSAQLRQFLSQLSIIRQQMVPVLPPNFNILHLRRRLGVPA